MDAETVDKIDAMARTGEYGTMCKACSDRVLELVGHVRDLELALKVAAARPAGGE